MSQREHICSKAGQISHDQFMAGRARGMRLQLMQSCELLLGRADGHCQPSGYQFEFDNLPSVVVVYCSWCSAMEVS